MLWLSDRPSKTRVQTLCGLLNSLPSVARAVSGRDDTPDLTVECSVRSAWDAIRTLLKRGPASPPVYQGQYDPGALFNALKVFVCG